MVPTVIDHGPIPKLEIVLNQAKETGSWFEAIVLAAIQLERHGFFEVRRYLESSKVDPGLIKELIEGKHLPQIAKYLLILKRIDESEHSIICRINHERNKYLHRKEEDYKYLIGTKATKTYEPLVREAIRILKEKLNVYRVYVFK